MYKKHIILIGGIPAAGKTTYAEHLSEKLAIPMLCKDHIKERLHDVIQYNPSVKEEAVRYGIAGYGVLYYVAEAMMKVGSPLILESNFTPQSEEALRRLIQRYGYAALTILFGGDMRTLHERFLRRDHSPDRHPGLVSSDYNFDFETFRSAVSQTINFNVGPPVMKIDATDFGRVSYEDITNEVLAFLHNQA